LTYGALRFVLETFRNSNTNTMFHLAHLWAAISLCIGAAVVIELKEKPERRK